MGFIIALVIILVIILAIIGWVIGIQNNLVKLRNRSKEAWANTEAQLQRRFDLIPNLVNTVKGYAKHESETLTAVMKARSAAQQAMSTHSVKDAAAADKALSFAVNAVSEAYPELQANRNFMALQEELTTTENQIAFARQAYNDCTMEYNNAVQMFPGSVLAGMLNFREGDMFEVESEAAAHAPTVQF